METSFSYYIFCIVAVIVGLFVVKKIAGCVIKAIVLLAIIAALAAIYYFHII